MKDRWQALGTIFSREVQKMTSRPLYLFTLLFAPLFALIFFTSLLNEGLPHNMPVGFVDMDGTSTTRQVARTLDAFDQTQIVAHYRNFSEARHAIQKGEIYGFFYIPRHFTQNATSMRQPKVSFYYQSTYLITGSLLMKDMKTTAVLVGASAARSTLRAKGIPDQQTMFVLQPVTIDVHPIHNPELNYSVYLNNTIVPGVLMLIIFLMTTFSIGNEIKEGTAQEWLNKSHNSIVIALLGKLLPYTLVFLLLGLIIDITFYGVLGFPCQSGFLPMLFAMVYAILASQGLGVLIIAIIPSMRMSMSIASLWGVVSISISGFTFPYLAFYPFIKSLSYLFPLRHYFLIYVTQALNGFSMVYAWESYLGLTMFILMPLLFLSRLKHNLLTVPYIP